MLVTDEEDNDTNEKDDNEEDTDEEDCIWALYLTMMMGSRISTTNDDDVEIFEVNDQNASTRRWKSWKSEAREKVKSQKISYVILVLCASLMVRKPRGTEQCGFSCCKPLLGRQLHT